MPGAQHLLDFRGGQFLFRNLIEFYQTFYINKVAKLGNLNLFQFLTLPHTR